MPKRLINTPPADVPIVFFGLRDDPTMDLNMPQNDPAVSRDSTASASYSQSF